MLAMLAVYAAWLLLVHAVLCVGGRADRPDPDAAWRETIRRAALRRRRELWR